MSKLYSAKPKSERLVVSPGREPLVMKDRYGARRPISAEPDWNQNAPLEEIPENFKAAMRAKGWLRTAQNIRKAGGA